MEKDIIKKNHKLVLDDRKNLVLSGVINVVNFDTDTISLKTECGSLVIKGENLNVNKLMVERGELEVTGSINALTYLNHKDSATYGESFFSRIFK